jgi:hypothetical protein
MKMLIIYILLIAGTTSAQDTNKVVIDERSERPMLVGYTTREAFKDSAFVWWYNGQYELYDIDTTLIDEFIENLNGTDITIVMGTWCGDSRREVPRFLKILDYAGYPEEALTMINVDRSMTTEGIDIKEMDIKYVPTFIFYSGDEEIGRIIESPQETLEIDMAEILR